MEIYETEFTVDTKEDQSPLTAADRRSHDIITGALSKFSIPILSEEGRKISYDTRREWNPFWLIDPLDGTKEFVKRNGEFTVNIALIENGRPTLGVVFLPVTTQIYLAEKGYGAYRTTAEKALQCFAESNTAETEKAIENLIRKSTKLPEPETCKEKFTIVGSRSHGGPELEAFVAEKRREYGEVEFIPAGSSLKICRVAEGRADIYPRFGPTSEWDTAAGQAVAEAAGAFLLDYETRKPLRYNKENLLNPWFIVLRHPTP